MSTPIVIRPQLSARIAAEQSRTAAFTERRFGKRKRGVAIELIVPAAMRSEQRLLFEALVELCIRMEPIVEELRLVPVGDAQATNLVVAAAAERVPMILSTQASPELAPVRFAIGASDHPFVDANDWQIGFNTTLGASSSGFGAGPVFAALEASKYLFLRAAEIAHETSTDATWSDREVFDLCEWRSVSAESSDPAAIDFAAPLNLALVGCGGVGAGYLWFLRKSALRGRLLLIDHDAIEWHNMNRLFYALIADADEARSKVDAAARYMQASTTSWSVEVVARAADHDDAIAALRRVALAGGMIASAVGEPETRKFLARRGFATFFDAGTNSLGSAQALALVPGRSSCIECHARRSAAPAAAGNCAVTRTNDFAGVVPHLAAYAGAMLAMEQLLWASASERALNGVNTQSVLRKIERGGRETTSPCAICPHSLATPDQRTSP